MSIFSHGRDSLVGLALEDKSTRAVLPTRRWSLTVVAGALRSLPMKTAPLVVALALAGGAGLQKSATRFFWHDEIYTVAVASQGSVATIWSALDRSVDANPPPYYLLEHLSRRLISNEHVAYRLPSLLGVLGVSVALFVFIRRRAGVAAAVLGSILPLTTSLFDYAIEARPYALMLCCLAWAMVVWQRADRPGHCIALGCLLACAAALHYYAFLGFVPLAAAEGARSIRTRHLRLPVWSALVLGALPLVAFWPLLWNFRGHYGAHFWARPSLAGLPTVYNRLLNIGASWGAGISAALIIALVVTLMPGRLRSAVATATAFVAEELVLILGLIALPAVAYLFARATHSAMTPHYALATILGISLAIPIFVACAGEELATSFSYLVLFTFISQQTGHFLRTDDGPATAATYSQSIELKKAIGRSESETGHLPVVVSNGLDYLPLAYYNLAHQALSVAYLADAQAALEFADSDTVDLGLLKLRDYLPLDVQTVSGFVRDHDRFLLYSGGDSQWDWLPRYLLSRKFILRPVDVRRPTDRSQSWHVLYLVDAPRTGVSY